MLHGSRQRTRCGGPTRGLSAVLLSRTGSGRGGNGALAHRDHRVFAAGIHTVRSMTTQASEDGAIMAASNSEIYKAIGEFGNAIKSIERGIDEIKRELAASELASSNSRAGIHRRLDDIVQRTANLEGEMVATKHETTAIKDKVAEMETVTVEVKTLRTKAEGAGTLGRWLLRIGVVIVTAAGWLIGAYTWLTGRPPP